MAKIYNNNIFTAAGFKYNSPQPLDDRDVVESYSDLAGLVRSNIAYEGMDVYVVDDKKTYRLIDGSWMAMATEVYADSNGGSGESNVIFVNLYEEVDKVNQILTIKMEQSYEEVYNQLTPSTETKTVVARFNGVAGGLINDIYYLEDWEYSYMTFTSTNGTTVKTLYWYRDDTVDITEQTVATEEYVDEAIANIEVGSSESDVFVIQWDGASGDKTYKEVSQAIAEYKIPVLYDRQGTLLGVLSGHNVNGFVFSNSNYVDGKSLTTISVCYCRKDSTWEIVSATAVTDGYLENALNVTISANNEEFKSAVLNCFPDADTMTFPLDETVSEVSEE